MPGACGLPARPGPPPPRAAAARICGGAQAAAPGGRRKACRFPAGGISPWAGPWRQGAQRRALRAASLPRQGLPPWGPSGPSPPMPFPCPGASHIATIPAASARQVSPREQPASCCRGRRRLPSIRRIFSTATHRRPPGGSPPATGLPPRPQAPGGLCSRAAMPTSSARNGSHMSETRMLPFHVHHDSMPEANTANAITRQSLRPRAPHGVMPGARRRRGAGGASLWPPAQTGAQDPRPLQS